MRFFLTDFRYAWRMAKRMPGVTLGMVALLALGMGGVTAVFNPIYALLYAPLPFPEPERLVRVGGNLPIFNLGKFEQREQLGRVFSNLAAYVPENALYARMPAGHYRELHPVVVSGEFFATMGARPLRGSACDRPEDRKGIVVSYRFWRDELRGADDAIGKSFPGDSVPVVGVMPKDFDFLPGADLWRCADDGRSWPGGEATQFVGRLRPGVTLERGIKELLTFDFPKKFMVSGKEGPVLQPLQTFLYGDTRPLLRMLGAVAALFLVLVCAGVVNLLITQGVRRQSEMALRQMLGATRRNLVCQLLRETLPLVIAGGLGGWWLAGVATGWLYAQFPALEGGAVTVPVRIAFFAALVLLVTLVAGLAPALYAASVDLNTCLKAASSGRRRFFSAQELLTGAQLALTLGLLIGTGLLLRSLMYRVDFPTGWSAQQVAVVSTNITPPGNVNSRESLNRFTIFFRVAQRELAALPEALTVGVLTPVPFSADARNHSLSMRAMYKTRPPKGSDWLPPFTHCIYGIASSDGFALLGIPLVAGRFFTDADVVAQRELDFDTWNKVSDYFTYDEVVALPIIINQALAQKFWPGENAIGKKIYDMLFRPFEVVGVVRDFHLVSGHKEVIPATFTAATGINVFRVNPVQQTFLVKLRPGANLEKFQEAARTRLTGLNASLAQVLVESLSRHVAAETANQRLTLWLLGAFAFLGIVVSALGVYATVTLMAAARMRENGIRLALGAQPRYILRLVLWRGARALVIGFPCGLFLGWALGRALSGYLVEMRTGYPAVWLLSGAVLLVVVTVAAFIPALRASRTDPMVVMRSE